MPKDLKIPNNTIVENRYFLGLPMIFKKHVCGNTSFIDYII